MCWSGNDNEKLSFVYAGPDRQEAYLPTVCASNHAANLLELPNGDLLCCWFAGSKEGNCDISIYVSRKSSGSTLWELPEKVSDDERRSEQNPSLFLHPDGEIWLVYTAQLPKPVDTGAFSIAEIPKFNMQYTAGIRRKISRDGGKTWGRTELLFSEPGSFCRQSIQVLSRGRWVFGNWRCFCDDSRNGSDISLVRISDDRGNTWKSVEIPNSRGKVHATILETEPDRLVAFFRSRAADYIYCSHSLDGGETWEEPRRTVLPNNNAGISACLLKSGRILMAYNDCSAGESTEPAVWPARRCPITVALSEDGGNTWPYRRILEPGEGYTGEKNDCCNRRYEYPAVLQGKDGKIHIVYSYGDRVCIKYVCIGEEWILERV